MTSIIYAKIYLENECIICKIIYIYFSIIYALLQHLLKFWISFYFHFNFSLNFSNFVMCFLKYFYVSLNNFISILVILILQLKLIYSS